uniref:EOG090X0BWU n=1 Tax=Alona affinis TaxID=381656 RepID=A0A9N6WPA1_9CRUS|nr:EOG090X0BWU [Alona affinis]
MEMDLESIMDELNEFDRQKTSEIPKALDDFILHLAKTGETVFPWPKIRGLIRSKLETVISEFRLACHVEGLAPSPNVEPFHYETMKDKILEQFDSFNCAPFTIQRLCELLCAPRKHYKRTDKFMRGIEKNLLVVSTVDPEQSSRKQLASVSSSQSLLNGVVESNRTSAFGAMSLPLASFGNKSGDQQQQRPSSVASDVASISDADSGISDTEDEEKPAAESSSHLQNKLKDQQPVEPSSGQLEETEAPSAPAVEPPVDPETPAVAVEDTSAPIIAVQEPTTEALNSVPSVSEEAPRVDEVRQVEESDPATRIANGATTTSSSPSAVTMSDDGESTSAPPASNGGDVLKNKRPLEREEEAGRPNADDDDHSPDAKQPRYLSPDKVAEDSSTDAPCEVVAPVEVESAAVPSPQGQDQPSELESKPAEMVTEPAVLEAPAAVESH